MLGLQTCASEASSVWILGFKIQVLTLMRQNITHQSHFPRPTLSTKPLMPSRRCLLKTSFRYNYFPNALPLNTISTGPRGLSSQLSTWRVYIHLQKCVHVIVGSDPITPCLATLKSPTRYTAPTAYLPCLPGGPTCPPVTGFFHLTACPPGSFSIRILCWKLNSCMYSYMQCAG